MSDVLLKLVNMSITASWLVLAVVILRLVLKKASRWLSCLLWGMVGLRLVLPFSVESLLSLIPSAQAITTTGSVGRPFEVTVGVPVIDQAVGDYLGSHYYEGVTVPTDAFWDTASIAAAVWLCGVALMLVYSVGSYVRLQRTVAVSLRERDNIFVCDAIDSPFILGVIRPRIYLPSGLSPEQTHYVIAHEQAHLKRCDHWWKPLGFALLSVYWFNPMLWVAYILFCRDIEAACDEKVIASMEAEEKKGYSEALVACSVHRRRIMVCPLAFGEVGVKARIRSILHYKKPTVWILAVSLMVCTVAAVCLLTDPKEEPPEGNTPPETAPIVSVEDAIAYYDDLVTQKDFIWYNSVSSLCASLQCPASFELTDILRLEQWQETQVDNEEYLGQRILLHSMGSVDGYALKLSIGEKYGGIEWYTDVIDEMYEDGVTWSHEEMQGVLCFALPQSRASKVIEQLNSLAWRYEIGKNVSVYTRNGDFELIEDTAQYQLLKESGGDRYLCVPKGRDVALGAYTGDVRVTFDGNFLHIVSDEGEYWYEPDNDWYWSNDREYSIDRVFERRGNHVLFRSWDTVEVYDTTAQMMLARVMLTQAYASVEDGEFIQQAHFTGDFTVEVVYYEMSPSGNRTLRTLNFEFEDLSKRDPSVDPPKTALKMPEKICLISEGWSDWTLTITKEDDHSLRFVSSENGTEVVRLSEANILRLNRLYAAVPEFSDDDELSISDGVDVVVEHDGVTDTFSSGAASYVEADYFIDQLCLLSNVL